MNSRVLLVGLAVLLAGTLALVLLPTGGDPGEAGTGEAGTAAARARGLSEVELADGRNAPVLEVDAPTPEAARRRTVEARGAAADGTPELPTGPKLKGRVVDSLGRGVPNATVEMRLPLREQGLIGLLVEDALTRQATETDGLGYFELIGLPGKTVEFDVGADGYAKLEAFSMDLPEDFTQPVTDLVLRAGVVLHGSVVDLSGRAIEGAELYVVDAERPDFAMRALTHPEPDAVSDAEGRFQLPRVAVGKWAVEVRASERPLRTFRGEALQPGRIPHGLWFELPEGGTIRGSVVGLDPDRYPEFRVEALPTEGMPFFGGRALERPRGELDSEGRFELRGLDRDLEYTVKLAPAETGLMAFAGVVGTRSESLTVRPLDVEVELTYKPGAELRFQVLDATDRTPVEIYVARFGQQGNVRSLTTPEGEVRTEHREGVGVFSDLYESDAAFWNDGEWRLEIDAPGYELYEKGGLEVRDGVDVDLGEILLSPSGRLNLVVKDAADGEPINSAIVRLTKLSERNGEERAFWRGMDVLSAPVKKAKTDAQGRATLDGFGSEPAELVVSRSRYADFVQRVVLGGDDMDLEVLLSEEAQVNVQAMDENGNELGEVEIERRAPGDEDVREKVRSSNRGRVRFRGLEPGEHLFRLAARGENPAGAWQPVTVVPGARVDVVLLGPARGRLVGRVTESGRPVADVQVRVLRADGADEQRWERQGRRGGRMVQGRTTKTGTDGRYSVDDLDYGDYVVEVSGEDRAMPESRDVTVDRAEVTLDVQLSVCGVEGVVYDSAGNPLVGAEVRAVRQGGDDRRSPFGDWNAWGDPSVVELAVPSLEPGRRTNATGAFRLNGLEAGVPVRLVVTHPNAMRVETEPFVLEPDEVRTGFVLRAAAAGSLTVRVRGADRGFYRVKVAHTNGQHTRESFAWGSNASPMNALEPGDWTVELYTGGRGGEESVLIDTRRVEVVAGQRLEVEFDAP